MTQQATAAPIALSGAPIITQSASEQGEPTIEELSALLPEPTATTIDEDAAAATEALKPAEATEEAATEEPIVEPVAPVPDEALERAAKAAKVAREGSRRYAAQQAALAEQREAVQRSAREAEALRRENAAHLEREAAFKADPYKALKVNAGMTDADLAARALRENTPEAVTQRLQERLDASDARAAALEQRLANEQKAAQTARLVAQAEANFAKVADDATSYPELSQLTTDGQLDKAHLALRRMENRGHKTGHLTTEQIAEAAEMYIKLTRKEKAAAPAAPAAPAKAKPSGATLTNKQAQTRAVAPAAWDSLTEEQQLAHIAASLPEPT